MRVDRRFQRHYRFPRGHGIADLLRNLEELAPGEFSSFLRKTP